MDQPTGISTYAQNVLPFLKGFDPTVLSTVPISGFKSYEIPAGLSPNYGSKGHLRRLCWLQRKVPQYVRRPPEPVSQSLSQSRLLFSPLPEAPLYSKCRFIVMVHDTIPLRFPSAFGRSLVSYFRHYVRRVLIQAEHIICNSESTASDVVKFYQIPAKKITPIALAYDQQNFRPMPALDSGPRSGYFLYVGRHNTHKNLPRLISAFSRLWQTHKAISLWLVGPQDLRYTPGLMAQVAALELTDRVRFLDYVPYQDLPVLLNGAIALTFPSLWEGFGLPVLEAMACATPVITSNVSSLPEVVGDAALLVDPYSVDGLAEAMRAVLENSALRQHLSQAGLTQAECFSWRKTGQQTAEVIEGFL